MNPLRLFVFIIGLMAIASCTKYDNYLYEVVAMKATNSNNSGELPVDALSDSVPAKAYCIKMNLTMEARGTTGDQADSHESSYVNEDRLVSMNVYSLNDFDSSHIAGKSLNEYFFAMGSGSIQHKIESGIIGTGTYPANTATSWGSVEYLMLMHPPKLTGSYLFVTDLGMSDGRHLIDTTSVILY